MHNMQTPTIDAEGTYLLIVSTGHLAFAAT